MQHIFKQIAPLSQLCSCLLMNRNCVSSLKEPNLEVQQWTRISQQFFTLRVCTTAIGTILLLAGLMGFLGQPGRSFSALPTVTGIGREIFS